MSENVSSSDNKNTWRFFSALGLMLLGGCALLQGSLIFGIRGLSYSIHIQGASLALTWAAILIGFLVLALIAFSHIIGEADKPSVSKLVRRGEYAAWSLLIAAFIAAAVMNH